MTNRTKLSIALSGALLAACSVFAGPPHHPHGYRGSSGVRLAADIIGLVGLGLDILRPPVVPVVPAVVAPAPQPVYGPPAYAVPRVIPAAPVYPVAPQIVVAPVTNVYPCGAYAPYTVAYPYVAAPAAVPAPATYYPYPVVAAPPPAGGVLRR